MPSAVLKVSKVWTVEARYYAAAAVDIRFGNTSGKVKRWAITTTDSPPTIDVSTAIAIKPRESIAMQLDAGVRLWVAGDNGTATVETMS